MCICNGYQRYVIALQACWYTTWWQHEVARKECHVCHHILATRFTRTTLTTLAIILAITLMVCSQEGRTWWQEPLRYSIRASYQSTGLHSRQSRSLLQAPVFRSGLVLDSQSNESSRCCTSPSLAAGNGDPADVGGWRLRRLSRSNRRSGRLLVLYSPIIALRLHLRLVFALAVNSSSYLLAVLTTERDFYCYV